MIKTPSVLVITGPTAVGKTDIAIKIADHIPCEIINADIGQCYLPLTIGTAKPDWRNEKVPHHLFDIVDEPVNFSASDFRKRIVETINQVLGRGNLPIVVGGSVFYIQTLFFPLASLPLQENQFSGVDDLWNTLVAIDPDRAHKIHKNDTYRVQRALAIWEQTKTLPSLFAPTYNPPISFFCSIVIREKEDLYKRINSRLSQMIDQGWLEEVRQLEGTEWADFLMRKKIIGYDDILEYINDRESGEKKESMIKKIQQKTRNYAKRQLTFLKKFEKKMEQEIILQHNTYAHLEQHIEVLNLTLLDVDLYIKHLLKKLSFVVE